MQPTLEETPPFMRATTQASMDPPGPYETHSTKAYFNVTLPEKDWTPEHVAEHMAAFNVGTIISTSVHEAYPGHYVQFLWAPQVQSKVRKLIGANTNIEGWAHYCEQMMLDQGYGQLGTGAPDARTAKLIRLGQLQDALLRDARFVVSLRLHTGVGGAMTFDEAVNFFVSEGYQSRSIATMETKRGTSRCAVPVLHAGEAGDHEAARGCEGEAGCGVQPAEVSRRLYAAGFCAGQGDSEADAEG